MRNNVEGITNLQYPKIELKGSTVLLQPHARLKEKEIMNSMKGNVELIYEFKKGIKSLKVLEK